MKTAQFSLWVMVSALALSGAFVSAPMADDHHSVSELEAQQAYDKAAKEFQKTVEEAQKNGVDFLEEASDTTTADEKQSDKALDVSMMSYEATALQVDMPEAGFEPISDIRLAVDLEHKTLKQIVDAIVAQAKPMAGPWQVKWRIAEENEYILNERVNLTAETTFEEFMDYLTDRVNNMTGIELFVSVFETSRIIIISDTYY